MSSSYDVVIVGGGHNALTAATYLAREGLRTLLLERLDHTGGAAVSTEAFAGTGARLSRYSYLVSVLPELVVSDLGLDLELRSRRTASYTPVRRGGRDLALLAERPEGPATAASFRAATGSDAAYDAWRELYTGLETLAGVVSPTLTEPLPRARGLAARVDAGLWRDVVERPLGAMLRDRFADDVVRGVVGTDALIGTFADLDETSLVQNRCFLYHLVGNGTGEWRVPVGGMGAVTDALADAARRAGTEIRTGATVTALTPDGEVTWVEDGVEQHASAGHLLAGCAPYVLDELLGDRVGRGLPHPSPKGPSSRSTSCSTDCRGCARATTPRSRSPAPSTSPSRRPSCARRTTRRPPAASRRARPASCTATP